MKKEEIFKLMDIKNNHKGYNLEIFCDLLVFHGVESELTKKEFEYILNNHEYETVSAIKINGIIKYYL